MRVAGKQFQYQLIGAMQVLRVAGECDPPKRSLPLAKQRPDVFRHEAGDRKRIRHAGIPGLGADVVPVVECDGSAFLQVEHRPHMRRDARAGALHVVIRRRAPQLGCRGGREAGGDVAVERIVCRRLIGDDVGGEPAPHERRQHLRTIAHDCHREWLASPLRARAPVQRLVQRRRRAIEIPRLEPALDPCGIHFDRQTDPFIHRRGEWLRAAHAAQPAREDDAALEGSPEMPRADGAERFVRPLQDPLRTDVDP